MSPYRQQRAISLTLSALVALGHVGLAGISSAAAAQTPGRHDGYGSGGAGVGRSVRVVQGSLASGGEWAAAAPVANGDFETGTFSGWTRVESGSGGWVVYEGKSLPVSGHNLKRPPQGRFAAVTDMKSQGTHILYRDLTLPPGEGRQLSFLIYYDNWEKDFFPLDTLDHTGPPNQQYRVDLVDPSAPVDSVAAGDVLLNIFRTEVGDPAVLAPTPMSIDLTPFAGQTVRLRFAEVDNRSFLHAAVDAVQLQSRLCKGVPVTIFGTDADDRILGTAGDDVVLAGGGDDSVRTLGGSDLVCSGDGDDLVQAGPHRDTVLGEKGDDKLLGQGGRDRLKGGSGKDRIKGGGGRDNVNGQGGRDNLNGQGGSDKVRGGEGKDTARGGAGDDLLRGQGGNDKLLGQGGDDKLVGGPGTDQCDGGGGSNTFVGCEK